MSDHGLRALNDPELSFVAEALDPSIASRELQGLFPAEQTVRVAAARVIRHRPGRRCLIEYVVEFDRHDCCTMIGKIRARGADAASFALSRTLREQGFGAESTDGIQTPTPIGVIDRFHMWLQEKVPGEPATDMLRTSNGTGAARRVAEVAYKLQETKILPRRRHTMADELRILEHALNATARDRPIWSDRIARISEACRRLGASVRQLDPRPIHRDFYGDQVLIDGASIYLVDLDLFCLGDPALDIGNFSGHIVEQALRENGDADAFQDRKRAMTERFLELTGDVTHAKAIAGYATLTLARHLYISSRITKRRRTTERLVDLCEQRLGLSSGAQPRIANARGHAYAARPTRAPDGHGQESPV